MPNPFLPWLNQSVRRFISMKKLISMTGKNLVCPFYHAVCNESPPHLKYLYKVRNPQIFEKDLDFFLKNFDPVSLDDFSTTKNLASSGKKKFFLSFDDGLREVFEVARPVLLKKGIPATIFFNTAFIDNRDMFYRFKYSLITDFIKKQKKKSVVKEAAKFLNLPGSSIKQIIKFLNSIPYEKAALFDILAEKFEINFKQYLKEEKPYMSSSQIQKMLEEGFSIGSHSIDHPDYMKLSFAEQIEQTEKSLEILIKKFGINYRLFSFPFTDHQVSDDFFTRIFKKNIADFTFGTAGLKDDHFPCHIQRIPMEMNHLSADKIIKSEYLNYYLKKQVGKNFVQR